MNKILTFLLVISSSLVFSQTITTQGLNFTPDTININLGDTITFSLGNSHNAVEVSQSTYLNNGTNSNGGFSIGFGQTNTFIAQFSQSYYYVCQPHVNSGMKGVILVNNNSPSSNCIDSSLINPMCICPFIYAPVCACNGLVYSNNCLAQCDGNTIIGPVDPTLVPGQPCSLSSCSVAISGDSVPCTFPSDIEAISSSLITPLSYNWTYTGTNISVSTSNIFSVPNYYISGYTVTVTDNSGCIDSASINISALPLTINSTPDPPVVCQGDLLQLSVDNLTYSNITWIYPSFSLSNPLVLYPNNDSCYVAEASDVNSCLRSGIVCIQVDSCLNSFSENVNNFIIYPNPAKDNISISFNDNAFYSVSLLNMSGEVLEVSTFYSGNNTINIEKYKAGIYFVKVETKNASFYKKIMILNN